MNELEYRSCQGTWNNNCAKKEFGKRIKKFLQVWEHEFEDFLDSMNVV